MNNSWWQEVMRFFLQGMTLKQLVHMLLILIVLVVVMPISVKEWINLHNPEILPDYWMYYVLLFCSSYVLNGIASSAHAKIKVLAAQRYRNREEKSVQDLFDSLTLGEKWYLAFAVDANNRLSTEKGSSESISLLKKGLLTRIHPAPGYPQNDRFVIPEKYFNECYLRFAGKKASLMEQLAQQDELDKKSTP